MDKALPELLARSLFSGFWRGLPLFLFVAATAAHGADDEPAELKWFVTRARFAPASQHGVPALGEPGPGAASQDAAIAPQGTDMNLRWRRAERTLWLGHYRDASVGEQTRAGWEEGWPLGDATLLSSMQVASGGFMGGSLGVQVGSPWFVQAAWGRTNLKPYVNLNFDPNDAITVAGGWQGEGGRQWTFLLVGDDRLGTGQRHAHLNLRWPAQWLSNQPPGRVALDVLRKTGVSDVGPITAWGWTLTAEQDRWSLRLGRDPYQNFSNLHAWRLSLGVRFR